MSEKSSSMPDAAEPGTPQGPGVQGPGLPQGGHHGAHRGTDAMVPAVTRPPLLPSAGAVIQAGAFGAALSGVTTAISAAMLVKAGHMNTSDAVKDVSKAAVQGAATMAVASTVAHVVRARPVIGLAVLAVAGIGLFMMMSEKKAQKTKKAAPRKASVPATTDAAPQAEASDAPAPKRRRTTTPKTA